MLETDVHDESIPTASSIEGERILVAPKPKAPDAKSI